MKTHISLNVSDIEKSVGFYRKMLATEPVKYYRRESEAHVVREGETGVGVAAAKTGYAKFDVENPPLNLTLNETDFTKGGSLSHLGLQVDSTDGVHEFDNRWKNAGLITVEEKEVVCCYAKQDKTWVRDPDGNEWEAFVVIEDVAPVDVVESACCGPASVSISGLQPEKNSGKQAKEPAAGCC